jgi:hypothetical protein
MTFEEDLENYGEFEGQQKISPDEVSRKFNLFNLFLANARMKISPIINDSAFLGFIGPRRTSKSTMTIASCHALNPDFEIDDICFSFEDLKRILNDHTIKKKPIAWEEASVTAYNRDFMEDVNKKLNKYFQVFGFRNLAIIANFQHLSLLDNHTRMQLDVLLRFKSYYGSDQQGNVFTRKACIPYKVLNDGINDPLILPYKIPRDMCYSPVGEIPFPPEDVIFKMFGVKKSFMDQYQKRKIEFFNSLDKEDDWKLAQKEIAVLKKKEQSLEAIAKYLQNQGISQDEISGMMGLKRQTASRMNIFEAKEKESIKTQLKANKAVYIEKSNN